MNPEKFSQPFKNQEKVEKEAHKINDMVGDYYGRPRVKKDRPVDEVAHEIIKDETGTPIFLERLSPEDKQWYENMKLAGVRVLKDGFLEISRWDNTGQNFQKPKLLKQKIDGVNSAIRMQDHILRGYRSTEDDSNKEFSKLESIQEVIEYANELLNRWGAVTEDKKKELQQQLSGVVLQLEKCRNEFKVEVKDQADAVMTLKDKLNRENPSALAARTIGALNSLTKRINEMQLIAPQMALRKEVLTLEKRRVEGVLRKADARLSGILHHAVFNARPNTTPESRIKDFEVRELDLKLGQVLYLLDSIYIAPYFQLSEQAKFFIITKVKKFFRHKKVLIENLDTVKANIKDIQKILNADIGRLG